jgi:hypothetical protein
VAQPPRDHAFVKTTKPKAAAAASIGAGLAGRKRAELLDQVRSCFVRVGPWLQAGKYTDAVISGLPKRNGWTVAEFAGDRTPDRTQRLLNRASWDTFGAMSEIRRFAVAGLEQAALSGRRGGLVIGAIGETGQEKAGSATAGVKRQYLGCAGRVANGTNTVHLSCVREKTGHALAGARQWIPQEHIEDPVASLVMGLPLDLAFRTKGQLAIDICADAYADGQRFDFACGDEVSRNSRCSSGTVNGISPAPGLSRARAGAAGLPRRRGRGRPAGRPRSSGARTSSGSPARRPGRPPAYRAGDLLRFFTWPMR